METARSLAFAKRAEQECERDTFPPGFPNPIDVPAARYTDPDFFALERHHLFEKCWLFVAHADQLDVVARQRGIPLIGRQDALAADRVVRRRLRDERRVL